MDNFAGMIIMVVCCFGCAMLFFGIGRWADQSKKPVHFWSGTTVNPEKVSDIPAYNHACALMWKQYSIPYWFCGIFSCLGVIDRIFSIIAVILLFVACLPGAFWLVGQYSKIEKMYFIR